MDGRADDIDIDLVSQLEIAKKFIKPPILAFKVIQVH